MVAIAVSDVQSMLPDAKFSLVQKILLYSQGCRCGTLASLVPTFRIEQSVYQAHGKGLHWYKRRPANEDIEPVTFHLRRRSDSTPNPSASGLSSLSHF